MLQDVLDPNQDYATEEEDTTHSAGRKHRRMNPASTSESDSMGHPFAFRDYPWISCLYPSEANLSTRPSDSNDTMLIAFTMVNNRIHEILGFTSVLSIIPVSW
jgi:hypothetical protein